MVSKFSCENFKNMDSKQYHYLGKFGGSFRKIHLKILIRVLWIRESVWRSDTMSEYLKIKLRYNFLMIINFDQCYSYMLLVDYYSCTKVALYETT